MNTKNRLHYLFALILVLFLASDLKAQDVGAAVDLNCQFTDYAGRIYQPWEDPATRAIVTLFVTTDCPIANAYQPEIQRQADNYARQGVRFFLIYPGLEAGSGAIDEHRREFDIKIPCVADTDYFWTRKLAATVTPQAVVLVRGQSEPVYSGRIDNRFADYGKRRAQPTERDMTEALEAIISGQPVAKSRTQAIGCQIESTELTDTATTARSLTEPRVLAQEPQESARAKRGDYRPAVPNGAKAEQLTLEFRDEKRNREIPLRVYLPEKRNAAPVVLFSHGLGGNRDGSTFLGNHWAQQGYVAVFMQHPGSDESVWKDTPLRERMAAMSKAANGENLMLRIGDVPAVIDQLERWQIEKSHPLNGRIDLTRLGMSGHSFGAITTQSVSGQAAMGRARGTDPRIKAALILSPSSPRAGKPEAAFGEVKLPWMLMTATEDLSPIGDIDMESRLAVFPALAVGDKYELVLDGGQHSVFNDRGLLRRSQPNKTAHHKTIMQLSTAFWDAYLRGDESAKQWLQDDSEAGPRSVMDRKDRWQTKTP